MTHAIVLTRDGAEVARVRIPRADYERLKRTTLLEFPTREPNEAFVAEIVTPGRVYRLVIERATSGRRWRGVGR